jgi:hypothetical protein
MEGEIRTGNTYGRNVQFIRPFIWEKQKEKMNQDKNLGQTATQY